MFARVESVDLADLVRDVWITCVTDFVGGNVTVVEVLVVVGILLIGF